MADYGSNAEVQKLAFGAVDSNQDTRSAAVRAVATSFINATLNRTTDIATPTDLITDSCNLIAAGLILTGQMQVQGGLLEHPFFKQGLRLLELSHGDEDSDAEWGTSFVVERFNDTSSLNHDPTIPY